MSVEISRRAVLRGMAAVAAGGLATAVSACGGSKPAPAEPESGSLQFWTISLKGKFSPWVETIIQDWEKAHPKITIDWVDVPGSSVAEKYLSAIAAKQAPDVANMYQLSRFVEAKAVLPVNQYVPAKTKADFYPSFWDALTFGGKTYGVPWYANSQTFLYSKKQYADAGLDPGRAASTYAQAIADGKTVHAKTGHFGPAVSFADGSLIGDLLQLDGVRLISADHKKATLNTRQAASSLKRWVDAYKEGAIPPEAVTATSDDTVGWFLGGRCASFPGGAFVLNRTTPDVIQQEQFAIANGLRGGAGKYAAGFQYLVVSAQTKLPRAAAQFALHAAQGKYQLALAKQVAVLPSNKSGYDDPFWKQQPQSLAQQGTLLSAKQMQSSVVLYSSSPPVPQWARMVDVMKGLAGSLLAGQTTPSSFLSQVEQQWNGILGT